MEYKIEENLSPEDILFSTVEELLDWKKELLDFHHEISTNSSVKLFIPDKYALKCKECKEDIQDNDHFLSEMHLFNFNYFRNKKWFSKTYLKKPDLRYSLNIAESSKIEINFIKGESFEITLNVCFSQYGIKTFPLVCKIEVNGSLIYELVQTIFIIKGENKAKANPQTIRFISKDESLTKRSIIYSRIFCETKRNAFSHIQNREKFVFGSGWKNKLVPDDNNGCDFELRENLDECGVKIKIWQDIPKVKIPSYDIPKDLTKLFTIHNELSYDWVVGTQLTTFFNENLEIVSNEKGLVSTNYKQRFQSLLWLEEFHANKEIKSYNKTGVRLINNPYFLGLQGIKMESLAEGRPSVLKSGTLIINPSKLTKNYEAKIAEITNDAIYIRCPQLRKQTNKKFNISFVLNLSVRMLSHYCLDQITYKLLQNILFPSSFGLNEKFFELRNEEFFEQNIAKNESQAEAIRNIVCNSYYPAPYLLFGPPGTGKTATMVEAILQMKEFNGGWNKDLISEKLKTQRNGFPQDIFPKK